MRHQCGVVWMMSVCYFTLSHGTATAVTNATDTAVATRWVENTVATYCCSLQRVRHTKKTNSTTLETRNSLAIGPMLPHNEPVSAYVRGA